jgi:predicted ester cyclase
MQIRLEDTVVEGDKVIVRLTLQGTHHGEGFGIAHTHKPIRLAGIVMAQFAGGQIVRSWNSWDQLDLLKQLGALPASGGRFLAART